jgi:hypothetical protein
MSLMQNGATCPNCNEPITGQYCANCGQRVTQVSMSVRRILLDVLEDQFSLNSSLARTMKALFFKPGFLTTEYFSLRIARYVPPFRLYLIASLLFFLLLSFMASGSRIDVERTVAEARDSIAAELARDSLATAGDTAVRLNIGLTRGRADGFRFGVSTDPTLENWAEKTQVNLGNETLNRAVKARLLELGELPPDQAFRRLIRGAIESTPKVMFLILPIYALLLKLLYARRKRLYVEHFIFALHLHAFAFLLFFISLALRQVPYSGVLVWLWLPVYTLLAMKHVYGQGWFKTTAKWMALGFAYMIVLTFGVLAAFVGALFGV